MVGTPKMLAEEPVEGARGAWSGQSLRCLQLSIELYETGDGQVGRTAQLINELQEHSESSRL